MDLWRATADFKLSEHSKALAAKLGHSICISSKWETFMSHPSFISKSTEEQQKYFTAISDNATSVVINSIIELCKDSLVKTAIVERFRGIIFQFDTSNSISASDSSYSKHYIVQQQGTDIVVTINMNQHSDRLYYFAEKLEIVLDVRTDQDKRDTRHALDKIQEELRVKTGLDLRLDIDFSFATQPEFLGKSLDERSKIVKQMYGVHFPRLVISSDGLLGLAADDIMKRAIQGRISQVVVALDTSNRVKSTIGGNYAKHFETVLRSTILLISINMAQYSDQLYYFKDKVEALLNVRTEQDKRDARTAMDKLVTEANKKLGFSIEVDIDWQFASHPNFTSKALNDQTTVVRALHQTHLPRILCSNDGLPQLVKDNVLKTAIQNRISRLVITYDPTSTIDSNTGIGGNYSRHFSADLQSTNLVVAINMDKYGDTLYYLIDKVQVLLNVRVEQEKRNANEAFAKLAADLQAKIGLSLDIQFDWQFTEHATFKSKALDEQSTICKQVYAVHAPRVLLSSDGLIDSCKDEIMRREIESKVHRVVFSYDPENTIAASSVGGNYARHYETSLSSNALVVRINLAQYSDVLYYFKDKLDVLFNIRVEQERRWSEKPVKEIEQALSSKLGFLIELGIDWIFTHDTNFTSKSLDEQSKIIKTLYQIHLPRIMTSSDGLADLAKDEIVQRAIKERIRSIHVTFDAENRIHSAGSGNYGKHYDLMLLGLDMYIPINLNQYGDYLYSFKEKMEVLLNVRAEQEKRNAQLALNILQQNLAKSLGFSIDVNVDWKFIDHPDFTSRALDDQSRIIRAIHQNHLPRVLTSSDGIITLAKDDLVKQLLSEQIKQVLFIYDPENQVSSNVGGNLSKHYTITLASGALLIVVNLRQHNDALYGSMEKIECSLNARIPKEKRDATKALMDFQNQLSASFGQAIELDIDWAFTTSASFLSKSLGEYSRIIQSIWKTALPRIVLGNESIPAILNQAGEINFLSKVKKLVFNIDCKNSVNAEVGDKAWEMKLKAPVLSINVNMEHTVSTWHQLKDKLLHAFNTEKIDSSQYTIPPFALAPVNDFITPSPQHL